MCLKHFHSLPFQGSHHASIFWMSHLIFRPNNLQFVSRLTHFKNFRNVDQLILRLQNCEIFGQAHCNNTEASYYLPLCLVRVRVKNSCLVFVWCHETESYCMLFFCYFYISDKTCSIQMVRAEKFLIGYLPFFILLASETRNTGSSFSASQLP